VDLLRWRRTREDLIRPSLCVLYWNIVGAISGTDIGSHDAALTRARRYRETLMSYLRPKVNAPEWVTRALEYPDMQPTEENRRHWRELEEKEGQGAYRKILSWDRVASLDLSAMPQPHIEYPCILCLVF